MSIGDYVYDWDLGLWGLIIEQIAFEHFVLLYADSECADAYASALTQYVDMSEAGRACVWGVP